MVLLSTVTRLWVGCSGQWQQIVFPWIVKLISHFHLVPSLRMGSTMPMLSLCAMHKDIFMGLGAGKYHVDML